MKTILALSLGSVLAGLAFGAILAYREVPTAISVEIVSAPQPQGTEPAKPKPQPKIDIPEKVYEFGKIERGASMSHEFIVRNVGDLPLSVEVASTTCKCTVGDLSKNEIAPNEESVVLLEWVAKTGPGPFRHGAVLSTNDPTQSAVTLTVEGKVVESTAMSPSELVFGTVRAGQTATASLMLMTLLDHDLEIEGYKISDDELAEQMEVDITAADPSELPSSEAVRGLKVEVTYRSDKTIGPFRGWLTLDTSLDQAKKLVVPIMGSVVGDVSVFGPGWNAQKGLLSMGSFSSRDGKRVALKVAVRGEDAQESQWVVAKVDPPQLQVSLGEPRKMGGRLVHVPVVVEVPAGTQPMVRMGEPISSDAQIVLRSEQEAIPDIRLRVHFAIE